MVLRIFIFIHSLVAIAQGNVSDSDPGKTITTEIPAERLSQAWENVEGLADEDESDPEVKVVQIPSEDSAREKAEWAEQAARLHSSSGLKAPNHDELDEAYESARSAVGTLDSSLWYLQSPVKSSQCIPKYLHLGSPKVFSVYVGGEACQEISAPDPLQNQSIPEKTETAMSTESKFGVYVFKKELNILRTYSRYVSPFKKALTHNTQVYMFGAAIYDGVAQEDEFSKNDFSMDVTTFQVGVSAPFVIGPVPFISEVGVKGKTGSVHKSRQARLWTAGRAAPHIDAWAYATAYVDLFVFQAGLAANLLLLRDSLDIYGLASIRPVDMGQGSQLAFSHHLVGDNVIEALNGDVNAFVKVRTPFSFYKYKKIKKTLFRWQGPEVRGQIFSEGVFAQPLTSLLSSD